jgi:hypothetical protein
MLPPYCYRPLGPYLASFIPASPLTAINLLNLVALFITLVFLDRVLGLLGVGGRSRMVAGLLFIFSFPVFYYATIGFVDPLAILWATLLFYLTLRGSWWPAAVCSVLAVLTKETNLVFTPLPGAWLWLTHRRGARLWAPAILGPVASLVAVLSIRALAPFPEQGWFWKPSLDDLTTNLSRPRAYLSLIMTLGIPGVLAIVAIFRKQPWTSFGAPAAGLLALGCLMASSLYAYSLVSAYADGRVIWIVYPFAIPIAASLLGSSRKSENRLANSRT